MFYFSNRHRCPPSSLEPQADSLASLLQKTAVLLNHPNRKVLLVSQDSNIIKPLSKRCSFWLLWMELLLTVRLFPFSVKITIALWCETIHHRYIGYILALQLVRSLKLSTLQRAQLVWEIYTSLEHSMLILIFVTALVLFNRKLSHRCNYRHEFILCPISIKRQCSAYSTHTVLHLTWLSTIRFPFTDYLFTILFLFSCMYFIPSFYWIWVMEHLVDLYLYISSY